MKLLGEFKKMLVLRLNQRSLIVCATALLVACTAQNTSISDVAPKAVNSAFVATLVPPDASLSEATPSASDTQTPASKRLVIEGTGTFVASEKSEEAAATVDAEDGFTFDFVDTEIVEVVSSVVGDGLGLTFYIDPQIKGTMTLTSAQPLAPDQVIPALEAALALHGVAIVPTSQGGFQIVPLKDAPKRITTFRSPSTQPSPGFGIEVVPLSFVSAAEMEQTLRPFSPDGGIVRVDTTRNLLVLAGTSQELGTMLEVVRTFDVDWLAGMSFGLFPLRYVDAKTAVDELSEILAPNKSSIADAVRLIPMTRLNSVMVVTSAAAYLKKVEEWIDRIDLGANTAGRRIYVYDVQNGKAQDLANSLNDILSLQSSSYSGSSSRNSSKASSLLAGGGGLQSGAGSGAVNSSIFGQKTTPDVSESKVHSSSSGEVGALRIVPNDESNSLLIFAEPAEFAVIESALRRLDVPPIQVMIEASIAEVSLTDDLRYGLQWSYESGQGPVTLSESSNGGISRAFPGFSYLFTGRQDIRAVLNALESLTDVEVLSSPKLLVLNNHEAKLQIGDQVPVVIQSAVGTGTGDAPIVNSVELRDTGVILGVTPRVNKNGLVLLDIAQEVSDVIPTTTSGIDSPSIQQRRLSTTVIVRNNETIALGGMIRRSKTRSKSGIPYLQRIPLLGALFGASGSNGRRLELIVLIKPRVVRSSIEAADLMDDLHDQFKGLRSFIAPVRSEQMAPKDLGAESKAHAETPPAIAAP